MRQPTSGRAAARAPAGFRSSIAYVPRRSSEPASPVRPRLSTPSIFPVLVPNGGERVAILPGPRTARAVLGRPARRRAGCRPAGGWGPAAVARRRTQNSSIFIIVDKCTAPLRSSRPFRRRAVGRGGGWRAETWAETIARARIVSIKIELSEVSDVYKTKMGSSTVHAEESRYRRHPECLPLGTRTANMEQHKHAERSEPELPPGALALAPRPPI